MILRSRHYSMASKVDAGSIRWDGGQRQQQDHKHKGLVAACLYSMQNDIVVEIDQHHPSLTDAIISPLAFRSWEDLRGAEIGKALAKLQVLRLVLYARTQKPTKMIVLYLSNLANALTEGGDPDAEGSVTIFFELLEIGSKEGEEDMKPILEVRCFDLRRARAPSLSGQNADRQLLSYCIKKVWRSIHSFLQITSFSSKSAVCKAGISWNGYLATAKACRKRSHLLNPARKPTHGQRYCQTCSQGESSISLKAHEIQGH